MVGRLVNTTDSKTSSFVHCCFYNQDSRFSLNGMSTSPYFATVTTGLDVHRLRIIDTVSEKLVWEQKWPISQVSNCVAFGSILQDSTGKKKRQVEKAVVAVGFNDGSIQIFSVSDGSLLSCLKAAHSSPVTDLVIVQEGSRIFSSGLDGIILETSISSSVCLRKINTNIKNLTKIQISHDSKLLLAADHQMTLFSLENNEKIKTFTGHSTKVTKIMFSIDDRYCISVADQERTVSVWDCEKGPSVNVAVLRMEQPAIDIGINNSMDIFALDETGIVSVWSNFKISKAKPVKASNSVQFVDEKDTRLAIISCCFENDQLLTARGNALKPVFERVKVTEKQMKLVRSVDGLVLESKLDKREAKTMEKVVGATDFVLPEAHQPNDLQTMEERLVQMEISKEPPAKITTGSLSFMLSQAIHSNDKGLMEQCLSVRDSQVIASTCSRLSVTQVIPFLDLLLARLQQKPTRVDSLVEWMRAIIISHAAYLMSVKDMSTKLAALYQTLDSRVQNYQKYVKLYGKLDLVMSQMTANDSDQVREPTVYYQEEEEAELSDYMDEEIVGDDVEFDEEMVFYN